MHPDSKNFTGTGFFSNLKWYFEQTSMEMGITAFWLYFSQRE